MQKSKSPMNMETLEQKAQNLDLKITIDFFGNL